MANFPIRPVNRVLARKVTEDEASFFLELRRGGESFTAFIVAFSVDFDEDDCLFDVGDVVLYSNYESVEIQHEGFTYVFLCPYEHIIGVMEDSDA